MADLLPPENMQQAVTNLWTRMGASERQYERLERSLEVLREDLRRELDARDAKLDKHFSDIEAHLSQQDSHLSRQDVQEASRAHWLPPAVVLGAVVTLVAALVTILASHPHL